MSEIVYALVSVISWGQTLSFSSTSTIPDITKTSSNCCLIQGNEFKPSYQLKPVVKKKQKKEKEPKKTEKLMLKNTYFAPHPGLNVLQDF